MTSPAQDSAPGTGEFLVYTGVDGKAYVQVRLAEGSVWMTQRQIAEVFGVSVPTINEHLAGIYVEEELDPARTVRQTRIVQTEGKRSVSRQVEQFALPTIMAIGSRVHSLPGSIFRQWATERLNESLVQGYALDEERLKSDVAPPDDYFDELMERIRDIRSSERRFYEKVADVYEKCSIDYERDCAVTQRFYAAVLEQARWAIQCHNATDPMLSEDELRELDRMVAMYLDYAEDMARMRKAMTMADWTARFDDFLTHVGRISPALAPTEVAP